MRQHAERLRELPRRECIGREPLVIDRRARNKPVVFEVGIKVIDIFGQEHTFVDNGLYRKRADIEAWNGGCDDALFNAPADNIKFAF